MGVELIIGIILFIILSVIIFKIVKKVVKAFFLISALAFVVFLVLGFFVYQDAVDLQQNFPTAEKIFLMEYDNALLAGVTLTTTDDFNFIDVADISEYYETGDMESVLGSRYKAIVFKKEAFSDIENVEIQELSFTRTEIDKILMASDAADEAAGLLLEKQGMPLELKPQIVSQLQTMGDVKGILFAGLVTEKLKEDPFIIIDEYKKGNVVLYPETIIFKLFKFIPDSVLNKMIKGGEDGTAGQI